MSEERELYDVRPYFESPHKDDAPPKWPQVAKLAFLLSTAYIVSSVFFYLVDRVITDTTRHRNRATQIQMLMMLTDQEKDLLKAYFLQNTKTQFFSDMDGVAIGLQKNGILYLASKLGMGFRFPYNIENWAWEYLSKHQELLERRGPATQYAEGHTSALPKMIG